MRSAKHPFFPFLASSDELQDTRSLQPLTSLFLNNKLLNLNSSFINSPLPLRKLLSILFELSSSSLHQLCLFVWIPSRHMPQTPRYRFLPVQPIMLLFFLYQFLFFALQCFLKRLLLLHPIYYPPPLLLFEIYQTLWDFV